MVNYRRNYTQGGSYFFTLNLKNRKSELLIREIDLLRESFRYMLKKHPCRIDAIVVLPDHMHAIFTLPHNDDRYASRWRVLKSRFTHELLKKGYVISKNHRGEYAVWQRRFWEHAIRNELNFEQHVNYIHYNPVKHGLVRSVVDWPYSSFHQYVVRGRLPGNWASHFSEKGDIDFGE